MSTQLQKKLSKSKKWIDYSSQQQNDHHHDQEKPSEQHSKQTQNHKKQETTSKKDETKLVMSTSHEPVKEHLLDDRKQLLEELNQVKNNSVWIQVSVKSEKDFDYLKEKVDAIRDSKNKQVISIFPSRDNKNSFDLRIDVDLCEKWIIQGFDTKNIITLALRKKPQQRQYKQGNKPKYQQRQSKPQDRDYKPIRQYHPQHTTSTYYKPKYQTESYNNNNKRYEEDSHKKKYVQKNPIAQKIQQKVEEELNEKKLQKKGQVKKENKGSKFYSKNPFEFGEDSDQ